MGTEALRAFWDERAETLGEEAGTRDRIAKALEIEAIRSFITLDIDTVLDFGCGTGETAVALARDFQVRVIGYDISPKMIEIAQERLRAEPKLEGTVEFVTGLGSGWLLSLPPRIDLAYTERMLQNLPSWEEQARTIAWLAKVAPRILLCENSQDGLDNLNALRRAVGLEAIEPPAHNLYLRDEDMASVLPGHRLEITYYSDLYYFLSRVVNAAIAAPAEPLYDAPVNQLARRLPRSEFGRVGQGRIWYFTA